MKSFNGLLLHSIYTAVTEANQMEFSSNEEREIWEQNRTEEIFNELKEKHFDNFTYKSA